MAAAIDRQTPSSVVTPGMEDTSVLIDGTPKVCWDHKVLKPEAVLADTLKKFNSALAAKAVYAIVHLFLADCYWRDHLASSWDLRTLHGHAELEQFLRQTLTIDSISASTGHDFRKPRYGPLDGISGAEGITGTVDFSSALGQGRGIIRLAQDGEDWKIFSLFLSLEQLAGCEEPLGHRRARPTERPAADSRNWAEKRSDEVAFQHTEPSVLIIGAGQAGLTLSARLKMLGVSALAIDTNSSVGDNWRKRYKQLVLHDPVWYDHMPYLNFPPHWPVFTPKDKLAEWFESYAKILELNIWTNTRLVSSHWDESKLQWTVSVERLLPNGGTEKRQLQPRHIVQATGHSGKKNMPSIRGLSEQDPRVCHSSDFPGARSNGQGRKAIVVGACNSGHDIARSFYENGYDVTMVQRSSTCVISSTSIVDIGLKGLYDEDGPPVEDADLALWGMPFSMLKTQQAKVTQLQAEHDAPMRAALGKAGFKLDDGPDGAGLICKYFTRGGGYYIDVGTSQLIAEGKIRVKQGQEITELAENGLVFDDSTVLDGDEIVFATGYQNMRTQARIIFGDELADRVSDVWGINSEGEFRTISQRSGHPGFWFFGGNLAVCRYYSRMLAFQIKASEDARRVAV